MIQKSPIGIDDFRVLRERNLLYVDKTHLITQILDKDNVKVLLLPRPRRFGKTLNMSTLKWFFEKREENVWHLFEGLHVARAGEEYRRHFQKYPVASISLKETKATTLEGCLREAKRLISDMYDQHKAVLGNVLSVRDLSDFDAVWSGSADISLYRRSLKNLTRYLHQVHGVQPIVIIDEYDAGIHAAHSYGFYKEAIDFFGGFFLAGLKDNVHLERAVMTGILRVSRESIFSDLNSVGVYTLLDTLFNTCFGFTEEEVAKALEKGGLAHLLEDVRLYYDGYEFGGVEIYNPWSILNFLENNGRLVPYWVGTSSNTLIKDLLKHYAFDVQDDIRTLLAGGAIDKRLDPNVVFPELFENRDALWSLLVFSGYLKASPRPYDPRAQDSVHYGLSIPNREVAGVYRTTFQSWLTKGLLSQGGDSRLLLARLLEGDAHRFEAQLQKFALTLPSYHDVGGAEPETFYQGLMIGLLASLEPEYEVRSNREHGDGRPDVLIKPRQTGKPGVILELKAAREGEVSIEKAMADGLKQLKTHDYGAELRAAGVEKIQQMVIAFDGKRVMVLSKGAKAPKKKRAAAKKTTKNTAKAR